MTTGDTDRRCSSPPVGGPSTTITPVQGAWGGCLQMAWAVGVGSAFDGDDVDSVIFVVDAGDDPVIPTAGAEQAFEVERLRARAPIQATAKVARLARAGLDDDRGPRPANLWSAPHRLNAHPDDLEIRAIAAAIAAAVWVATEHWQAQDGRGALGALIDRALDSVLGGLSPATAHPAQ
jgi:hypothetical protein